MTVRVRVCVCVCVCAHVLLLTLAGSENPKETPVQRLHLVGAHARIHTLTSIHMPKHTHTHAHTHLRYLDNVYPENVVYQHINLT